jgi:hypothetical protein
MTRLAPRPALHGLVALAALAGGCADDTGAVELAWVFVDRDGDAIYPGGVFTSGDERDSCGLPALVGAGEDRELVSYDLRVELEICDPGCAAGCDAEECLVVPRHVFPCTTARGNDPDVPASTEAYRFTVRAVLDSPALASECRSPSCLAVPAPRERVVTAGLVTDLQVYQLVVDVDRQGDAALDLEACGCA